MTKQILAGIALVLSAGAANAADPSAMAVTAKDAWARRVPADATNTAAYMTLENSSDKPIRVVSGKSDSAKVVELHHHVMVGDSMKMEKVESIEIPAHGSVSLQPKGLHVMLLELNPTYATAKEAKISLLLSNGKILKIMAPVKSFEEMGVAPKAHSHH